LKINEQKLARQKVCVNHILSGFKTPIIVNGKEVRGSILEAATGFGKTYVSILIIKDMNTRHPDRDTIVVVPNSKLYDDWIDPKTGHIAIHNLLNVKVFIVNTYTRYENWVCDLLVIDEIHRIANRDSQFFSTTINITKYKWGIGLSGSLSTEQKSYLLELGWKVVDTVSVDEAEQDGYITNSIIYNLAVPIADTDREYMNEISDTFKFYFAKFGHEFDLVKACNVGDTVKVFVRLKSGTALGTKSGKEWREWYAKKMNWDGKKEHPYSPSNIAKNAAMCMNYMRKRKTLLYNTPSKLYYVEQLVKKFSNLKTIIFSESSDFADKIAALFPKTCLAYHTKLVTLAIKGSSVIEKPPKEQLKELRKNGYKILGLASRKRDAIALFEDRTSHIKQLSTVRAIDEGVDIIATQFILQTAYSSTIRQDTQRGGRGKRIDSLNPDKVTLIVNLYVAESQEERWLRSKQSELTSTIYWVNSVEEIVLNQSISLYAPPKTQLPPTTVGAVSDSSE